MIRQNQSDRFHNLRVAACLHRENG